MVINKINLMIVIWNLYDINSLDEAIFSLDSSEYLKDRYNLSKRKVIYESLIWAEANPDFQFESIMKDAPVMGRLKFNNDEVYQYLMSFKAFMENKDYNLLTDDRPTIKPWED